MSNRFGTLLALSICACGAGFAPVAGFAKEALRVTIDEAKIAKIPANAVTLVIGNPIVADVTMLKSSDVMVLTGKSFGQTNVIALDAKGNVIDEELIKVIPASTALVVQRGFDRDSYSCDPVCMPTVQLGDAPTWFDAASGQAATHSGAAKSAAASGNTMK